MSTKIFIMLINVSTIDKKIQQILEREIFHSKGTEKVVI